MSQANLNQWRELIENYQEQHEVDIFRGREWPSALSSRNEYSRHIAERMSPSTNPPFAISVHARTLKAGDLCYATQDATGNISTLSPVMISRKLYSKSPLELLPKSLRPASSIDELSMADRVFGWVSQDDDQAGGEKTAALKSHVRFGTVTCLDHSDAIEEFDPPKILAILGQPKLQQGRFYVGNSEGKAQQNAGAKDKAGYSKGNRMRGPKVYPHHAQGPTESSFSQVPSNQNRSIKSWVKPETEFAFDIQFSNLSRVELGAIFWLLTLPREHYFRFGLGKPLGFGSVSLSIASTDDKLDIVVADGQGWIESLKKWHGTPTAISADDIKRMVGEFESTVASLNANLLKSFLQSARGFGELPIHYPSLPGFDGEHFRWFGDNEKKGKHSLPDLTSDVSLPNDPI